MWLQVALGVSLCRRPALLVTHSSSLPLTSLQEEMYKLRLLVSLCMLVAVCTSVSVLDTCHPETVDRMLKDACEAVDTRRSIPSASARHGPLLSALRARPPTVKVGNILGVPASWTVDEDNVERENHIEKRQKDDRHKTLYDFCCHNRCDAATLAELGGC